MLQRFKIAIIATIITFVLALVVGISISIWISRQNISDRQKEERIGKLGAGVGTLTCLVIAPFWIIPAAKLGKERRESAARKARRRKDDSD